MEDDDWDELDVDVDALVEQHRSKTQAAVPAVAPLGGHAAWAAQAWTQHTQRGPDGASTNGTQQHAAAWNQRPSTTSGASAVQHGQGWWGGLQQASMQAPTGPTAGMHYNTQAQALGAGESSQQPQASWQQAKPAQMGVQQPAEPQWQARPERQGPMHTAPVMQYPTPLNTTMQQPTSWGAPQPASASAQLWTQVAPQHKVQATNAATVGWAAPGVVPDGPGDAGVQPQPSFVPASQLVARSTPAQAQTWNAPAHHDQPVQWGAAPSQAHVPAAGVPASGGAAPWGVQHPHAAQQQQPPAWGQSGGGAENRQPTVWGGGQSGQSPLLAPKRPQQPPVPAPVSGRLPLQHQDTNIQLSNSKPAFQQQQAAPATAATQPSPICIDQTPSAASLASLGPGWGKPASGQHAPPSPLPPQQLASASLATAPSSYPQQLATDTHAVHGQHQQPLSMGSHQGMSASLPAQQVSPMYQTIASDPTGQGTHSTEEVAVTVPAGPPQDAAQAGGETFLAGVPRISAPAEAQALLDGTDAGPTDTIGLPVMMDAVEPASSLPMMLQYEDRRIHGRHIRHWIYPCNKSVREYQFAMVRSALFQNTLVCLPTGLGKTLIAAVVMYNFYRWFPQGKVVFMAPTRPLVTQQRDACSSIMGIPQTEAVELTASMKANRQEVWQAKRLFFCTPDILKNDLSNSTCPESSIVCVIVDECHRAVGDAPAAKAVQLLRKCKTKFRCIGLSATPGSKYDAIQEVIRNLAVSKVEFRSEKDADVAPYCHERNVRVEAVEDDKHTSGYHNSVRKMLQELLRKLADAKALERSFSVEERLRFPLIEAQDEFKRKLAAKGFAKPMVQRLHFQFRQAIFLAGLSEVLDDEGAGPALTYLTSSMQITAEVKELLTKGHPELHGQLLELAKYPHPKMRALEQQVLLHFKSETAKAAAAEGRVSRVIIFTTLRKSITHIVACLAQHKEIKARQFIGQGNKGKAKAGEPKEEGMNQAQQKEVLKEFREGSVNVLVATCIGEEGLDIPEVDLILCYDASASPTRQNQRMGRTARHREGQVVYVLSAPKEVQKYQASLEEHRKLQGYLRHADRFFEMARSVPPVLPPRASPQPVLLDMQLAGARPDDSDKAKPKAPARKRANKSGDAAGTSGAAAAADSGAEPNTAAAQKTVKKRKPKAGSGASGGKRRSPGLDVGAGDDVMAEDEEEDCNIWGDSDPAGGYWDKGPLGGTDEEDVPLAQRLAEKAKSAGKKRLKPLKPVAAATAGTTCQDTAPLNAAPQDLTSAAVATGMAVQQQHAAAVGAPWGEQQVPGPSGQQPWGMGAGASSGPPSGGGPAWGVAPHPAMPHPHLPHPPAQPAVQPVALKKSMVPVTGFTAAVEAMKAQRAEAEGLYGILPGGATTVAQLPLTCSVGHNPTTQIASPVTVMAATTGGRQSGLQQDDADLDVPLALRRVKAKSTGKRAKKPSAGQHTVDTDADARGGIASGAGADAQHTAAHVAIGVSPTHQPATVRHANDGMQQDRAIPVGHGSTWEQNSKQAGHAADPATSNAVLWQQGRGWQQQGWSANSQPQPQHLQQLQQPQLQHLPQQPAGLSWLSRGYAEAAAAEHGDQGVVRIYDTAGGFLPEDAPHPQQQAAHEPPYIHPYDQAYQPAQHATGAAQQQGAPHAAAEHMHHSGPTPQTGCGSVTCIPETDMKQPVGSATMSGVPATQLASVNTQGGVQYPHQVTSSHISPVVPKQLHFAGGSTPEAGAQPAEAAGAHHAECAPTHVAPTQVLQPLPSQMCLQGGLQSAANGTSQQQHQPPGVAQAGQAVPQASWQVHASTLPSSAWQAQQQQQWQDQQRRQLQPAQQAVSTDHVSDPVNGPHMQASAAWGPPTHTLQQQWQAHMPAVNPQHRLPEGTNQHNKHMHPAPSIAAYPAGVQPVSDAAAAPAPPVVVPQSNANSLFSGAHASAPQQQQQQQPHAQPQARRQPIVVDLITPSPASAPHPPPPQQVEPPSSEPIAVCRRVPLAGVRPRVLLEDSPMSVDDSPSPLGIMRRAPPRPSAAAHVLHSPGSCSPRPAARPAARIQAGGGHKEGVAGAAADGGYGAQAAHAFGPAISQDGFKVPGSEHITPAMRRKLARRHPTRHVLDDEEDEGQGKPGGMAAPHPMQPLEASQLPTQGPSPDAKPLGRLNRGAREGTGELDAQNQGVLGGARNAKPQPRQQQQRSKPKQAQRPCSHLVEEEAEASSDEGDDEEEDEDEDLDGFVTDGDGTPSVAGSTPGMARYLGWNLTQAPSEDEHLDVGALVRQRFGRGRRARGGRGVSPTQLQQRPAAARPQPARAAAGHVVMGGARQVHFIESECEEDGSQECEEDEEDGEADEDELEDEGIDIAYTQAPPGLGRWGGGGGAHHGPGPMDSQDTQCAHCGRPGAADIQCDGCDRVFHKKCVGLRAIPACDWFCKQCEEEDEEEDDG